MSEEGLTASTRRIRVLWNANAGTKGGVSTNRTGEPELRALIPVILQTDTPQTMDGALVNVLERLVAGK